MKPLNMATAMLDRRKFIKNAAAATLNDVEPRGPVGRMERLPRLDEESQMDFLTGFLTFGLPGVGALGNAFTARLRAILEAHGLDPDDDIPVERFLHLVEDDHIVGSRLQAWLSTIRLSWKTLQDAFHTQADLYFAEMESADNMGPGTLELNPNLVIPDYAKHEIHLQPGGYVGDPFAGYINYYYGNLFYAAFARGNTQDQVQARAAARIPAPANGQVRRILDMGCATGRLTFAMKERFPDAEVWGIDVGGPMVRYAHTRGVDLGIECHFSQRLAEDSKFPDGHFDMVVSNIVHHEVSAAATDDIVAEAYRVLRPGGVFFPIDHRTGKQLPKRDAATNLFVWMDHHVNNEVWRPDFESRDFADVIRGAGFDVDESVTPARFGTGAILAIKPA